MKKLSFIFIHLLIFAFISCRTNESSQEERLFTKLSSSQTGIVFSNDLSVDKDFDVFRYRNFYNGGGIAIGDVNNDGLPDIYITANMGKNKLYLNKGNFEFEDITEAAGVGGSRIWSTGVSMADINGDGLLDIYVCNSGDVKGGKRENELFINNGDNTFTESAAKYGLDDTGFSTHAVFFDYDQDGDLDCYILNNSFRPVSSLGYENIRHERDKNGGDKLYRNDNGKFIDVSEEAGIFGSVIGFGLGVTITDVNQDGWMDIYVSNDFFERDYLYINQADGTFKEELPQRMGHTSQFSMGADAADLNNDGFPEIFVTDMLPESEERLKTMINFDSYEVHQIKLENDYYEQYMRNTLQLNKGDGTFMEIGQYAGIQATDWSWGALLADFDNDTNKEVFVTNGIFKDLINQDFVNFLASESNLLAAMKSEKVNFQELVEKMPSTKLSNYLFKKGENLRYKNESQSWGLDEPSFSNGAAYADLDNDGDLDLVVNNVNQEIFIYQNNSEKFNNHHFLKLSLTGPDKNTFGIGARVKAYLQGKIVMVENIPTKGFQSSMDYVINLGLGSHSIVDSLVISWGYGKAQTLYNVASNQHLKIDIKDAKEQKVPASPIVKPLFTKKENVLSPAFKHQENTFNDFDREPLIYHQLSKEGPALAVGDINGDGLDDFYVGGASGFQGALYIQRRDGTFIESQQSDFENDKLYEDVDAIFFDADGDGLLDLFIVSGGNHLKEGHKAYQDRLYLNKPAANGQPRFVKDEKAIPRLVSMGSCVKIGDYNNDGFPDIFIGGRAVPGKYGLPATSHLLQNDGKGNFTDVTAKAAPQFRNLGMVTDAIWVDYDKDGDLDLVVVGKWMPIVIFKNNGANLERLNNVPGLVKSEGWWNTIEAVDLNNDGNVHFIAGNHGLNTRYKADNNFPLMLFINDFDQNDFLDHIYAQYSGEKLFPIALRHELINQMPDLKKNFVHYKDYSGKTIDEIFTKEQLNKSYTNKLHKLESSLIFNNGDGTFKIDPLPEKIQFSPVFSIFYNDNATEHKELLFTGNFSGTKPEEGRYDANNGFYYKYIDGKLDEIPNSGFNISGDVKKVRMAKTVNNKQLIIIARNNDELEFYEF